MRRVLPLSLLLAACGPSISDLPLDDTADGADPTPDTPGDGGDDAPSTPGVFEGPDGDGVWRARIDATDDDAWQHVDLRLPDLVDEGEPWVLAFRRFGVMVDGGISGDGGVEVAFTDDVFADVTEAPTTGWTTDLADADGDGTPELAFAAWYDYDGTTHVLTPAAGTWFVRTPDGDAWALVFTDYYDDAGTSGFPAIAFKALDGGDPVDTGDTGDTGDGVDPGVSITVDASSYEDDVYVDLDTLTEVPAPADPATDLSWDLAFRRATIRVNGGISGSGQGEASTLPDGTPWGDVLVAPTTGWVTDAEPPSEFEDGTALATWFDYDLSTHTVSPSGRVHAVRDADGDLHKVQVTGWGAGVFTVRVADLGAP